MTLQPGYRFAVAPHFHLPIDWSRRILIGSGIDAIDGRFLPRDSWRAPTTEELGLLIHPSTDLLDEGVTLFALPERLRSQWWTLLERSSELLGIVELPGFEAFVQQVGEFLAFKGVAFPDPVRVNAIASSAARSAIGVAWSELWGGINLGDENTSVVLLNLPRRQMESELQLRDAAPPGEIGDLARCFLRVCGDYPPIRLILCPGEGYRAPSGGIILGPHVPEKSGCDIQLSIWRDAQS